MKIVVKKLAELVGVVLLSAATSLSLVAIVSLMLSIVCQSPFVPILTSNPMVVICFLGFLLTIVLSFHILIESKNK
jgi:hypothetical protein